MSPSLRPALLLAARVLVAFLVAYMLAYRLTFIPDTVKVSLPIWPSTQYLGETVACVLIAPLFGKRIGLLFGLFALFFTSTTAQTYSSSFNWTAILTASPMAHLVFAGLFGTWFVELRSSRFNQTDQAVIQTAPPATHLPRQEAQPDNPVREPTDNRQDSALPSPPLTATPLPPPSSGLAQASDQTKDGKEAPFPGQITGLDMIAGMAVVYEGARPVGHGNGPVAHHNEQGANGEQAAAEPIADDVELTTELGPPNPSTAAEPMSTDPDENPSGIQAQQAGDKGRQANDPGHATTAGTDPGLPVDPVMDDGIDAEEGYAAFDAPLAYRPAVMLADLIASFSQEMTEKELKVQYVQGSDPATWVDESARDVVAHAVTNAPKGASIDIQLLDTDGMQTLMVTNPLGSEPGLKQSGEAIAAIRAQVNRSGGQLVVFTLYDEVTAIMQRPGDA